MIQNYLKQAWTMMRQNPLFSTLYIAGTGLAIALTTVMAIIYYVKIAPVYPEYDRSTTYYIESARFKMQNRGVNQWAFSLRAVQEWFYPLKQVEAVSVVQDSYDSFYVQPDDQSGEFQVQLKHTDPAFFRIYHFHFVEGVPFTQADLDGGIRSAVITSDLARRLFGTDRDVLGRTFKLDYADYRVCGVVRSGSYLVPRSYAQVYVPYTVRSGYDRSGYGVDYSGAYTVTILTKDARQGEAMCAEVKELVRRINLLHQDEWELDIFTQPVDHATLALMGYAGQKDFNLWESLRHLLLIVLVLLLVPALNLSGMISSRMESRLAEMGVRKSFGAGRRQLLGQVLWENLWLTLCGGVAGLLLAFSIVYVGREWVFTIFDLWQTSVPPETEVELMGDMLFAPAVFGVCLLICVVINILSALFPAWLSLRKPIVQSLFEKR